MRSAYYEKSKQYHPDRNPDDVNAAARFAEISEAYKVLGQAQSRRLYDEGYDVSGGVGGAAAAGGGDMAGAAAAQAASEAAARGRMRNQRKTGPLNYDTTHFNFTEFYAKHYGDALQRERERKERIRKQKEEFANIETGHGMLFGTLLLTAIAFKLMFH